jgi:ketosteroid isomerase-like protein
MSEHEVRSLQQIYGAMSRGSSDELLSAIAHNIEWATPETLPWGGTRHGREGVESVIEILRDHADAAWDVDDFLDADGRVVVLGRMRGRSIASGLEFEVPFAHVWGMSDGVPASFRSYLDSGPIVTALEGAG